MNRIRQTSDSNLLVPRKCESIISLEELTCYLTNLIRHTACNTLATRHTACNTLAKSNASCACVVWGNRI